MYKITNPTEANINVDGYTLDAGETKSFDSSAAAHLIRLYSFLVVETGDSDGKLGAAGTVHPPLIAEHLAIQESAKRAKEEDKLCPYCKRPLIVDVSRSEESVPKSKEIQKPKK